MILVGGVDSTRGAGIDADCETAAACKADACAVKTAWAQQGTAGLDYATAVSTDALAAAFAAAAAARPAAAVKLGMLPDAAAIAAVARIATTHAGPVVADPVMGPSAGGSWANASWLDAYRRHLPAAVGAITPNLAEARRLAGLPEAGPQAAAARLRELGFASVLVTGGDDDGDPLCRDYLDSRTQRCWLAGRRLPGTARGTGCAHATALGAALGQGLELADAAVLARLQVVDRIAGISSDATAAGRLPWLAAARPAHAPRPCRPLARPLGVCPLVASPEAVARLAGTGVTAVQLRLKRTPAGQLDSAVAKAAAACSGSGMRLFVNDHWAAACAAPAGSVAGVHLGQEDLAAADLDAIRAAGLSLGVSVHGWAQAAVALAAGPSYLSYGPVAATTSKRLDYPPLGAELLARLCRRLPIPAIAIGGIDAGNIDAVAAAGVGGVAAIAACATPEKTRQLVQAWARAAADSRRSPAGPD